MMQIPGFGLVLLLTLCAVLPAEAQSKDVAQRHKKFLNQHVYGDMAENWCNSVMKKRQITETDSNNCKQVNSFIRATKRQVKAVCLNGGQPLGGDNYENTTRFSVVTCELQSGNTVPHCDYGRGVKSNRYIRIVCREGWPVHYAEGIIG